MGAGIMSDSTTAPVRGIVLAAGYGTRLAPITDHLPKPLLPVAGVPLLDHVLARLFAGGVGPVAVNSHHLGPLVADHLAAHPAGSQLVHYSETEILGTGGALANAREFLAATPEFVVFNGDVLCDVDLGELLTRHRATGALATLLLVDHPPVNSVLMGADGAVRHIAGAGADVFSNPQPTDRHLTYTGIAVFDRRLLAEIGSGFSSLIAPLVRALSAEPGAVRGWAPSGLTWRDLGTLGQWLAAAGDTAETAAGFHLHRLTGHGSDRRFWRLGRGDWSAVAMASPPTDPDFERFLAAARFLEAHQQGPAAVLAVDPVAQVVLLEDLGETSLFALVGRPGVDPEPAYRRVVQHLLAWQQLTPLAAEQCPPAVDRRLDGAALRGETAYFCEQFLAGQMGLSLADDLELAAELDTLAERVAVMPTALIHRDFQSQNILMQGDRVRLVDFQGLRLGPLTYDLASLVWDPYVALAPSLRTSLVACFAAGCGAVPPEQVWDLTVAAGLQRVMQALGAFGYLGRVKGKTDFLAHIPAGVAHLQSLLRELPHCLLLEPMPRLAAVMDGLAARGDLS